MLPRARSILLATLLLASLGTPLVYRALAADLRHSPERPGTSLDDPIRRPHDLSGRSIKCPRVRAVHSSDPADEGATAWLFTRDPWMAYQRGRELFLREFSDADGVFGDSGRMAGGALDDEASRVITRGHVGSCGLCHNVPFRDGGAGTTIFKNGGSGRNTTHVFGAGLVEMLGQQLRLKLLELGDANRNDFIDRGESEQVRAIVENLAENVAGPAVDRVPVDFGTFGDLDGDGRPDLNTACFLWYVDARGQRISWARRLDDPGVAGYDFEVQVFGWGHGRAALAARLPVQSTLRAFSAQAFDLHAGLQAFDPTLNEEPGEDGLARVSLAGAQQFYSGRTRDRGAVRDARGVSLDDPDRDGVVEELSEGDLDLIEFYQLNHPVPGERPPTAARMRGRGLFTQTGCAGCHVPDWSLEPANPTAADYTKRYAGDRRFFDLEVAPDPVTGRLQGRVHRLTDRNGLPLRAGFTIRGVYSDFVHHDLGPAFHQVQFDGSVIRKFKTAPLWGVGSTGPYGHDGSSLDLEEVIRRHGGEAAASEQAWEKLAEGDREAVLEFLRGLVLYPVDDLPTDVDGDGKIAPHFVVAGQDTGLERLDPEWLFRTPGRIEGEIVSIDGSHITSYALTNVEAAYGAHLRYLEDMDGDGFPDALDRADAPGKRAP